MLSASSLRLGGREDAFFETEKNKSQFAGFRDYVQDRMGSRYSINTGFPAIGGSFTLKDLRREPENEVGHSSEFCLSSHDRISASLFAIIAAFVGSFSKILSYCDRAILKKCSSCWVSSSLSDDSSSSSAFPDGSVSSISLQVATWPGGGSV